MEFNYEFDLNPTFENNLIVSKCVGVLETMDTRNEEINDFVEVFSNENPCSHTARKNESLKEISL